MGRKGVGYITVAKDKGMFETIVIDYPDCVTKVRADVLSKKEYPPTDDYDPFIIYFLECPGCHRIILGCSDLIQVAIDDYEYDTPNRLWPQPEKSLDFSIPKSVRSSIEDARSCFQAKVYSACAVMCGRALEALCKAHDAKQKYLGPGLKALKDKGFIDERLYNWGALLQERRNIGAHATDEVISREDAIDILDFTIAICEYVYVLTEKYEQFKERVAKRRQKKDSSEQIAPTDDY